MRETAFLQRAAESLTATAIDELCWNWLMDRCEEDFHLPDATQKLLAVAKELSESGYRTKFDNALSLNKREIVHSLSELRAYCEEHTLDFADLLRKSIP